MVILAVGSYMLLSPRSRSGPEVSLSLEAIQKEGLSPVTRSVGPSVLEETTAAAAEKDLIPLKERFEAKDFEEALRLADEILAKEPSNAQAAEYKKRARSELLAAQIAPFLQSGVSSYARGNYAQCIADMEKVLNLDKDNKEAHKYLFQADAALAKPEIVGLIERHRVAEETKDLLTVLSHFGSPSLAESQQAEYRLLFNGYDDIRSIISKVSVRFSSRTSATAEYSQLLTAVYKKTGQRKILFEGQKTWQLQRHGQDWKISAVQ